VYGKEFKEVRRNFVGITEKNQRRKRTGYNGIKKKQNTGGGRPKPYPRWQACGKLMVDGEKITGPGNNKIENLPHSWRFVTSEEGPPTQASSGKEAK